MKSLLWSISFVFIGFTSSPGVVNAEVGDPDACWALADFIENWANKGRGAQYGKSFELWDSVYNSCLNDFQEL